MVMCHSKLTIVEGQRGTEAWAANHSVVYKAFAAQSALVQHVESTAQHC